MKGNNLKTDLDTRRIAINMVFSITAFVLNLGISFFITPYITDQFGSDAYGFVKLANDFTNYASLFSIALNSMASRFLMLEREKGNLTEARKYYSSITLANMVLTGILTVPSVLCVVFLERFLDVQANLVLEVKVTFAVTFLAFLINLAFSTYSNCYYLTNRLDISALCNTLTNILRVSSIIALFVIAAPKISYIAWGGLIATLFTILYNVFFTRKLIPNFRFHLTDFDWSKLVEVLSAGIWNSITKLSQIFSSGLDLMVTNLFIGSVEMGYLAIAKTIPNMLVSLNSTVANVFSPNLMLLYAKDDMNGLVRTTKASMKFMCLFVTIPTAILITMGTEFFQLWVPSQPARLINILSILTVINSCVTGPMQPLYQIFTITNKIKQSSIVMIIYGFSSIAATFICLQVTELGLYAVAGVSLFGSLIVALFYHLPYSAIYLGLPWHTFYPEIRKSVLSLVMVCLIGWGVHTVTDLNSWVMWFASAIITAVIGLVINMLLILTAEERRILLSKLKLIK